MSKIEKLINRFQISPKDFTYSEITKLLNHFGYVEVQSSGSRVHYSGTELEKIHLHKPHGNNNMDVAQLKNIKKKL